MPSFTARPSEVMYSQVSIANTFKNGESIGEVLDDIMEDRLLVSSLPKISVKLIDGELVSADNRRLWILKQLEKLGHLTTVKVKRTNYICHQKSARTQNVKIRGGSPGGKWYCVSDSVTELRNLMKLCSDSITELTDFMKLCLV
ncbi:Hypothetical predicted protein [Mytilus galloprovincialis]|uniref:Uncharacterized protein n=1 Tax=Mytilus galloprovincialis TaxID=29158 RepID=A0A8B6BIR0_MYTGA|nr:Hypothetical predicted protein [Mytilus galloprovincialis]